MKEERWEGNVSGIRKVSEVEKWKIWNNRDEVSLWRRRLGYEMSLKLWMDIGHQFYSYAIYLTPISIVVITMKKSRQPLSLLYSVAMNRIPCT
jgi:hypothetical protein